MSRSAYSIDKWTVEDHATGQKGIFVSRKYLAASIGFFALCAVVIPIIVHVARPDCDKVRPATTAVSVHSDPAIPQTTVATPVKDVRLPANVRPFHYAITLAPFMYGTNETEFYFTGTVNISIQVFSKTNSLKIHTNKIWLRSQPVVFDSSGRKIAVKSVEEDAVRQWQNVTMGDTLQSGMNYTIVIGRFRGPLKPDLAGLYLSSYMENGTKKYLATSQLQPTDARKAFPCFDEPAFKAKFSVSLVRPHNFKAISNMPSKRNETVSASDWFDNDAFLPMQTVVKEEFETTPIMSTYLLGFVVSQFKHISRRDSKGRLYRTWAREDMINLSEFASTTVVQVTEHFERYFNIAYPLNKTDQAALPDFAAGAMENWGLVLYREARLLLNNSLDKYSDKQYTARIISHEMAHMWFGNLVTAEWWDDIWLNEGFASFIQSLGVQYLHPSWEIDAQFVVTRQRHAFQLDSGSKSHPIYVPVYHPNEINQIFDSITYDKGSSVLRMLYYAIGSEVFRVGVSKYLKRNSYSNTFHTDLYHCLQQQAKASGKNVNVASMMDTWIKQMGYPVVNCSRKRSNQLLLTQQHFLSDPSQSPDPQYPSPFNFTWTIPITMATNENSSSWNRDEVSQFVQWMGDKSQTFSISSSSWYLLNLKSTGFYRVNYDIENWNALINQLLINHTVFTPHDRARIIDDSFTLASAGYINYSIPLSITQYLKNETHFVPWKSALSKLSYIESMLHRQSPEYGTFSKYMKSLLNPIYNEVGTHQRTSDSHLTRLTRELIVPAACRNDIYSCKKNVGALFETFVNSNFSQPIDPDIRRAALCIGIANSDADDWNRLFERLRLETHPGVQHDIIRALACSRRPWLLNYYLSLTLEDNKVRRQDASTVISSISKNPIGLQIVWDFLRNNWSTISRHHSGLFSLTRYVKNLGDFNTIFRLREMEAFTEENKETLASAAGAFDAALANVRINLNWMEMNSKYVTKLVTDLLGTP